MALLAFTALLAGCASAPAEPVADAVDGASVTAVRVVPVNHTVDWQGALTSQPCDPRGGNPCDHPRATLPGSQVGFQAASSTRIVSDKQALLWRMHGKLRIEASTPQPEVGLKVFVTRPDGGHERLVLEASGTDEILVKSQDLYLEEGERDLHLVLEIAQDYESTAAKPVRFDGILVAQAFVDAGDAPIIIRQE